jgi:beta-lactamase superfamily II metal-dependent hydrolase
MRNVRAELRVVEQHLEAMLLKVAHHGSASGTSSDLLATVHPRMRSFPSAREMSTDIPGVKCSSGYTRPR